MSMCSCSYGWVCQCYSIYIKEWNLGCQACWQVSLTTKSSHELLILNFFHVILCISINRLLSMAEYTIRVDIQISVT